MNRAGQPWVKPGNDSNGGHGNRKIALAITFKSPRGSAGATLKTPRYSPMERM
jgi:hypothetical protein